MRPICSAFKWLLRLILLLLFLGGGFFVYQYLQGIPRPILERVLKPVRDQGIDVRADRMYFNGSARLVGDNLRLTHVKQPYKPFFRGRAECQFDLAELWSRQKVTPSKLRLQDGRLRFHPETWGMSTNSAHVFLVDAVQSDLILSNDTLVVDQLAFEFSGIEVTASGRALQLATSKPARNEPAPRPPPSHPTSTNPLPATAAPSPPRSQEALFDWIETCCAALEGCEFTDPPRLHVDFKVDRQQPTESWISLQGGFDEPALIRGVTFDSARLAMLLHTQMVELIQCEMRRGDESLQFRGEVDLARSELIGGGIEVKAPFLLVEQFLPDQMVGYLYEIGLFVPGRVEAQVDFDPGPLKQVPTSWQGRVSIDRLQFRDVDLHHSRAKVELKGNQLKISDVEALVGRGWREGKAQLDFAVDLDSKKYEAGADLSFEPALLSRIIPRLEHVFRSIDYIDDPPDIGLTFRAQTGVKGSLVLTGQLSGTNLVYNGVDLDDVHLDITHSNRITSLRDIQFVRRDMDATGEVSIDGPNKKVKLDVDSTLHPEVITRLLQPKSEYYMLPYEFLGDNHLALRGVVDTGPDRQHALDGTLYVEQGGPKELSAGSVSFSLVATRRFVEHI